MSIVPSMSKEAKRDAAFQKCKEELKTDPDREPYTTWRKMVKLVEKPMPSMTQFLLDNVESLDTPEKRIRFLLRSMK